MNKTQKEDSPKQQGETMRGAAAARALLNAGWGPAHHFLALFPLFLQIILFLK